MRDSPRPHTNDSNSPLDAPLATSEPGTLSMWDGVSLVLGIVVGVSIFKSPAMIFASAGDGFTALGLWIVGGLLSLAGALCFAELATAYPRSGGEYHYLTLAYGRVVGFLFAWLQLTLIQTSSIGAMGFVFGDYSQRLFGGTPAIWAAGAVVVLSAINLLGVLASRPVQNLLTGFKVTGLAAIALSGMLASYSSVETRFPDPGSKNVSLALILILYAYGGWNDAAFVSAELRNRSRTIPRTLGLGVGLVMLIYVVLNVAYLRGLGYARLIGSAAPAADLLSLVAGDSGMRAMCVVVMISALGAMHGMIFSAARVHVAMGEDHALFSNLSRRSSRTGAPGMALAAQGAITLAMILVVGTAGGRHALQAVLQSVGSTAQLATGDDPFDLLVISGSTAFWLSFLLTGISLFVLRAIDPQRPRPFRVPGYPVVPLLFCLMSAHMLWAAAAYAYRAIPGAIPLLAIDLVAGCLVYLASRRVAHRKNPTQRG